MDVFYIIIAAAFFLWSIRSIFYFVNLWQQISIHGLHAKTRGRYILSFLLSPLSIISWLGIIFSFYVTFSDLPLQYYQYVVLVLFLVKAVLTIVAIATNRLKIPQFDIKSILVICLAFILTAVVFSFPLTERYLWLLLVDRMLFLFVIISLFLVMFPSEIIDDLHMSNATKKIERLKKLTVIIFIGQDANEIEYFAQQLLHKTNTVVSIKDPLIRPSVVAKIVLREVNSQTDFLIISLPHPRQSVLNAICHMVRPDYFVLSTLPKKAEQRALLTALLPFTAKKVKLLCDTTYSDSVDLMKKKSPSFFSSELEVNTASLSMYPTSFSQKKDHLVFKVTYANWELSLNVPLLGKHHIAYLLPSILLAESIGMTDHEIVDACKGVSPLPGGLVIHRFQSGITLIDGTKITQLSALQEGLRSMRLYRKERVVVFGVEDEFSKDAIKKLKPDLSMCSQILVMSQTHQRLIRQLMRVGTDTSEVHSASKESVIDIIQNLHSGDVVLFVGEKVTTLVEEIILSLPTSS